MPLTQRLKYFAIFFVALIGGLGVYFGYLELQLSKHAKPEPQRLTLAELSANGYGDNAHVIVSDFFFGWRHVISPGRRGSIEAIYVPAVPLGGDYYQRAMALLEATNDAPDDAQIDALAPPEHIGVLVKLRDAHDADEINQVGMLDELPGVVINEIETLGLGEQKVLREVYPGLDFDKCLILDYDREPATAQGAMLLIAGSAVALVLGLVLGLLAWRAYQRDQATAD